MLLDEIIDYATNDSKSVSVLLRKCLILGHRLKNQRLIDWATEELNGYTSTDDLPSYRVLTVCAKGYMSGPFGSSVSNVPIPSYLLDEQHRHFATTVYLSEPLSSYEELMRSENGTFRMEWPGDLILLYQDRIKTQNGCHLAQAWQDVGKNAFAQLFDAVRNRTLKMALEIRSSIGDSDERLDDVSPQTAAMIERSVTTNIYGGVNVIASDRSHVTSSVNQGAQIITSGNEEQLHNALKNASVPDSDIAELKRAIEQDGPNNLGARVKTWIADNAPKAVIGGIRVGTAVAQSVLTAYLMQYYGLSH